MARTLVEFFPADGGSKITLTTGNAAAYRLLMLNGIEPVAVEPQAIKSPSQVGETAVDAVVPPRVVVAQTLIQAASESDMWPLRAALARALVQQPVRRGATIGLGRLRVTADGRGALELDVIPRSAVIERVPGRGFLQMADIEWMAPHPYWREISDSRLLFESDDGGFEFGLEFPLEMGTLNVEQEVDNQGDVDTSIIARIYGDLDTARMRNLTTGEVIEITGNIPDQASGDLVEPFVEINTAFGQKAITLYNGDGTSESIMDRLNLEKADFWSLRPGLNVVKFEAETNTSGRAEIFWHQRYSGI